MKTELKRWSCLGLSAAFAGSAMLAACGQSETKPLAEPGQVKTSVADTAKESINDKVSAPSVSSEGGEGEGGVAVDRAATDPVVFRAALAITEAHIIAGRDAFTAGETAAAAEMFAHPVSEVLFDVGPYLQARGVESFDQMLLDASAACFDGESPDQIAERTAAIIGTLRAAAKKAPDDGSTEAEIQAGVAADQIDRAATMYGIASGSEAYEPYLDGYGFYIAAVNAYELEKEAIKSTLPETAQEIENVLSLLGAAYPNAIRPETLPGNPAALTAAASGVILSLGQ